MITQADAEKAVDWLRDNSREIAKSRAERIYMENWIKTAKAEAMKEHSELPVAAQEREALASSGYLSALQALKQSVEADEYLRWMATAAEAKISAWQTQCRIERAAAPHIGAIGNA